MKFRIQSSLLLSCLNSAGKIIDSKNAISILEYFLFTVKEDFLTVTASDQENTIIARLPISEVEGEGKFAIKVKFIIDAIKGIPDQMIDFDVNDDNYEIKILYGFGEYNIIGVTGDEYPEKKIAGEGSVSFEVNSQEILRSLQQTLFAVGSDDMRPVMSGILWDIKPSHVIFVSSDTHKLVRYTNSRIQIDKELSFIFPSKPASILINLLAKTDQTIKVIVDAKSITFETEDFTLISRFIEGRYPNYNSVIPTDNPYVVVVDRVCLLNAVKRVSVAATSGGLVRFELEENHINLRAQDIDYSTSAHEKVVCSYENKKMTIGLNCDRVIEVLNNINNDNVTIKFGDPSRPGIFLPEQQEEGEEVLILLMPMML